MSLTELPTDLPVAEDDGKADHLEGLELPNMSLPCTDGTSVEVSKCASELVLYVYPMTGRPEVALPTGWEAIPGARGCTPQSCAYRDLYSEYQEQGVEVFGVSTQDTEYQQEARSRLHLPFHLLSDCSRLLKASLGLPTFTVEGRELYRRLTLIVKDGKIIKVFYPVFPPDRNAEEVLSWLRAQSPPNKSMVSDI